MKKHKKIITVFTIIIVALIMFASFFGVYKKNENGKRINILPGYKLGMEFGKTRVITAEVSQEVTTTIYDAEGNTVTPEEGKEYTEEEGYTTVEKAVNPSSNKKLENYKKAKKIIEQRLKNNNITEYSIDLNEITGKMKIEIPENSEADNIESLIKNSGSFVLLDGETFEVVLDSSYLKKADVMYSNGDVKTAVFLQLEFNEEGTKKLEELNKIYVETTEEKTNENGETENVTSSKNVWVLLNDKFLGTTTLPNIVYNDKILFTYGYSNDSEEIQTAMNEARAEAILLNSGTAPLVYRYSSEENSNYISEKEIYVYALAIGAVFVIAYIYLVIAYKAKGFISVYFQVAYLAILLLVLRLTNVILTSEGMAAIVIAMILEYIFTYIVLRNLKKGTEGMFKKANLEFFLNSLPIYVIAVVFSFAKVASISSFGMTLFWGILLVYIYNFIFTKFIFENLSKK